MQCGKHVQAMAIVVFIIHVTSMYTRLIHKNWTLSVHVGISLAGSATMVENWTLRIDNKRKNILCAALHHFLDISYLMVMITLISETL